MNVLFWNLKKNNNANYIVRLINLHNIDIAVFCEHDYLNRNAVEKELLNYSFSTGMGGCEKVIFLFKNTISYKVRRESDRYAMYSFECCGNEYIIVGLHLPDQLTSDSDARKAIISDLMKDLIELEKDTNNYNTIIIGDFNSGPLDSELTQKNMFNAVPFKEIINEREIIQFQNKKYRRFYNPMIHYISEDTKQYGSIYYPSGSSTIVWYSYDQVIVRKPLADKVTDVRYCKTIGEMKLLTTHGKPNENISDHLPLIVEVKEQ